MTRIELRLGKIGSDDIDIYQSIEHRQLVNILQ